MIKSILNNTILKYITDIEKNKYQTNEIGIPNYIATTLRKNSKKKSAYSSNKIEGNPLSEKQANEVIDNDERKHLLKPEQEIRNYYLAMTYLDKCLTKKKPISIDLILDVQKMIVKGSSIEKIGFRGQTPPGILFAVYDSITNNPDYIPPEYSDVPSLMDELINYINTTDDHPLIIASIIHYQLVTIHPFEDGNGRTARLISSYFLSLSGYGFNGIGSLDEYFAYDIDEYYSSIQMNLPVLYYSGRNNPPHPEIWITYFLKMMFLYSNKVLEIQTNVSKTNVESGLSYLKIKEKELLLYLLTNNIYQFTPIDLSKKLNVTNKTVINRLVTLIKNDFVEPVLVKDRIRSYRLSEYSKVNKSNILKELKK